MIPRSLVPRDARPPAESQHAPRRLTTLLDERTIVAANLPQVALDAHSSIPTHLPLDVLASRTVVPRDTPAAPLDEAILHPAYAPVTAMDQRVTVPAALPIVELEAKGQVAVQDLPDLLDPDVLTTGDVNLMVEPVEAPSWDWKPVARVGSVALHFFVIFFLLFVEPKLFPYRGPTEGQIDAARQQLSFIYMPPDVRGTPRMAAPPAPQIHLDPRVLRRIAPPAALRQMPGPKVPERIAPEPPVEQAPDLPPAPAPQTEASNRQPDFLRGNTDPAPQPQPSNNSNSNGLILPHLGSPGRALEDSARQALEGGGATEGFGSPGGSPGGGGSGNGLGGAVQMLTPTEGIDFNGYLQRVVASVKRNWYAIMPESALLGDKGRVILQFRILRNGSVPEVEPQLMSTSGKEPLDRAAMGSIRASSPFEELPSAFSGPYIELRFIFLYNIPLSAQ